jgi:hypothetical protein
MKSRLLMGLVVAFLGSGAHAQSVINLNPGAFASGTDVSNAFAGVTLSTMTMVSAGTDPLTGIPLWKPSYSDVYAKGNLFAQYVPNVGLGTDDWGTGVFPVSGEDCFKACDGSNFISTDLTDVGVSDLLVSFNSPVSFASALQIGNLFNGEFLDAFNSSDQLVAQCLPSFDILPVGNYGCYSQLNTQYEGNFQLKTSVTATGITKILLGGVNVTAEIGAISAVSAPEIDPTSVASGLTLLLGGLSVLRGRRPLKLDRTAA